MEAGAVGAAADLPTQEAVAVRKQRRGESPERAAYIDAGAQLGECTQTDLARGLGESASLFSDKFLCHRKRGALACGCCTVGSDGSFTRPRRHWRRNTPSPSKEDRLSRACDAMSYSSLPSAAP